MTGSVAAPTQMRNSPDPANKIVSARVEFSSEFC